MQSRWMVRHNMLQLLHHRFIIHCNGEIDKMCRSHRDFSRGLCRVRLLTNRNYLLDFEYWVVNFIGTRVISQHIVAWNWWISILQEAFSQIPTFINVYYIFCLLIVLWNILIITVFRWERHQLSCFWRLISPSQW